MKILAFAGKRKVGKTRLSNELITMASEMGIKVRRVSFASSLKQLYCEQYNTPPEELEDVVMKEVHRAALEAFSEWVKSEAGDQNVLIDDMWSHIDQDENIIIDDLRRIEELQSVKLRGGIPYKVEADLSVRMSRGFKYDPKVDESSYEKELGDLSSDTFFHLGGGAVYNNKTIWEMQPKLKELILEVFL